jgi:hypothetical protein
VGTTVGGGVPPPKFHIDAKRRSTSVGVGLGGSRDPSPQGGSGINPQENQKNFIHELIAWENSNLVCHHAPVIIKFYFYIFISRYS